MPDKCEKCGGVLEPGDVKCPACGVELPEPSAPPPPQKAAVLAAAMLPLIAMAVFLAVVGGIIFAAMHVYRGMNKATANSTPPPAAVAPQIHAAPPIVPLTAPTLPDVPVVVPPPPVMTSDIPATVPSVITVPEVITPLPPPPVVEDFVPQINPPGTKLILRGEGLQAVDHVRFVSSHGATSVEAKIDYTRENQVIVTVPEIPFADYGIILIVSSPGGMAVLLDQHTGATPWGTDGHLHDTTVICRTDDEIETHDNMVLVAREGSAVSVGDNSIAFLQKNVTLKAHGKNCQIYYDGPIELAAGVSRTGLKEVPSLKINTELDAFRVKRAPPDVDQ